MKNELQSSKRIRKRSSKRIRKLKHKRITITSIIFFLLAYISSPIVTLILFFNTLKDNNEKAYIFLDEAEDLLKNEILQLEKNYAYLSDFGSIKQLVGSPLTNKFKKIKHSVNLSFYFLKIFPKFFL